MKHAARSEACSLLAIDVLCCWPTGAARCWSRRAVSGSVDIANGIWRICGHPRPQRLNVVRSVFRQAVIAAAFLRHALCTFALLANRSLLRLPSALGIRVAAGEYPLRAFRFFFPLSSFPVPGVYIIFASFRDASRK
ncbi:hypothetical protein KCP69_04660 [Salmonella enterica subsp. enterica]|nr:hypothetical protein KCP69_04660 [Salmonella enterica subsp. enterica]